jgi:hypothetical protein
LQFTCDLPDIQPDKKNQITKEDRELFDISNNLFQICELLDEYEVISLNDITNKIFITDFYYKKKNLLCATTFVTDYN